MSLAKPPRHPLGDVTEFDHLVKQQDLDTGPDYIQRCKQTARRFDRSAGKRETSGLPAGSDVMVVSPGDKEDREKLPRFKLLQFAENHRPAYYGTWRKHSSYINPRNPFKKDEVMGYNWNIGWCV